MRPYAMWFPRSHVIQPVAYLCFAAALFVADCGGAASPGPGNIDSLPALQATEDLRIGSVSDPDIGFSRIGSGAIDRDGQIYVYEALDQEIRVYDPSGNLLRTIGGPGEGPGEFRRVGRFGVVGDTVWTIDFGLRRITLFDRVGNVLSTGMIPSVTIPLPGQTMAAMLAPQAMYGDGLFAGGLWGFAGGSRIPTAPGNPSDTVRIPRLRYRADGSVVDTVGWDPFLSTWSIGDLEYVKVGGTRYVVPRPPNDQPLSVDWVGGQYDVDRPRAAAAGSAAFTITRLSETGDTIASRAFRYTPRPYPDAVLDTFAWHYANIPGGMYSPVSGPAPTPEGVDINVVRSTIRKAMHFPASQLPVENALAGPDGTLWLKREDDGGPTQRWMILNPDLSPRAIVELPRTLHLLWVSRDVLLGYENDESDVPWVVRFRVGIGG